MENSGKRLVRQMFMGEFHHTLDEKNRITIPSPYRQQIEKEEKGLVITRGLDKSLFLYPFSEWENLGEKLRHLSTTQANVRAFVRIFFSGAHPVRPDIQGRITLPQTLKEFAGIENDVTIIGSFNKMEIWSSQQWEVYYRQKHPIFENLSEKIMELEI